MLWTSPFEFYVRIIASLDITKPNKLNRIAGSRGMLELERKVQ